MKRLFLLSITALLMVSCATIFTGTRTTVRLTSNVEEADELTIDGYTYRDVKFPFYLEVKGGFNPTLIDSEKEGYESAQVEIRKSFNAVSVLNIFSLFHWAIDIATGAVTVPEYRSYELYFEEGLSPLGPKNRKRRGNTNK